jgi:excisionase family DNA binding protein
VVQVIGRVSPQLTKPVLTGRLEVLHSDERAWGTGPVSGPTPFDVSMARAHGTGVEVLLARSRPLVPVPKQRAADQQPARGEKSRAPRVTGPAYDRRMAEEGVEWVTTRQVAALLGVSTRQVRYLVEGDNLAAVRRGRGYLFRRAQVEVIANAREVRRVR